MADAVRPPAAGPLCDGARPLSLASLSVVGSPPASALSRACRLPTLPAHGQAPTDSKQQAAAGPPGTRTASTVSFSWAEQTTGSAPRQTVAAAYARCPSFVRPLRRRRAPPEPEDGAAALAAWIRRGRHGSSHLFSKGYKFGSEKASALNTYAVMKSGGSMRPAAQIDMDAVTSAARELLLQRLHAQRAPSPVSRHPLWNISSAPRRLVL